MQRKFLTNLALLLFLNFLVKPFWIFGIDRTVQNVVGSESYGFYFAIFNFSYLFNILLDFGITNFNNRNIAQNHQLLNKYFSSIVILRFILAVVYTVVTFTVALIIGYKAPQLYLLAFLAFNQFLIFFILYLRSNINGLMMFKTDSFMSVLDRLLMIVICGVLLWGNITITPFKIEWFVYAQTVAYLLTACVALFFVIRKANFKRLVWNKPFFVLVIKQSLPFAVLYLLMMFYYRIDTVMIERMLPKGIGSVQSGIYASAFRLLDASIMIAYLFSVLLLPIFSRMLKNRESVEQMVKLSFTLLITNALIIAIGAAFYREELMQLLYPQHHNETLAFYQLRIQQSSSIFGFLMGSFVFISSTYIFGTLLTANGNLKHLIIISVVGMVINVALNLILIPGMEAEGSSIASFVSQLVTIILQIIFVQYIFKFNRNFKYITTLLLFGLCLLAVNWLSKEFFTDWETGFVVMILSSFALAALLKLLNLRGMMSIIKNGT
ncbi:MAG: polysaccharide biosynthesis C-terminal domain-containing protein [Lentimicrobiaceae bacterium]|nr:polysaccharide biosynthesis C-terminal domain-containing protein [Lentimicrobiaceae bacterium]